MSPFGAVITSFGSLNVSGPFPATPAVFPHMRPSGNGPQPVTTVLVGFGRLLRAGSRTSPCMYAPTPESAMATTPAMGMNRRRLEADMRSLLESVMRFQRGRRPPCWDRITDQARGARPEILI